MILNKYGIIYYYDLFYILNKDINNVINKVIKGMDNRVLLCYQNMENNIVCFVFSIFISIFKIEPNWNFFFLVLFIANYVHAETWTVFCFANFIANGTKLRFYYVFTIYFIYLFAISRKKTVENMFVVLFRVFTYYVVLSYIQLDIYSLKV